MAIDARCTFCGKAYRLKDELAGKKVTCANGECRKVFPVVPLDAESLAAAALSDEMPAQAVAVVKPVTMTCMVCEHKWSVPAEMQGKNVLCPECKQRQKVPEPKPIQAADWRTGGGGPSLAKRETLENVTSARDTAMVSGETLKKTGIIDDGIEPTPLKVKLQRAAGALAVLGLIAFGIYYWTSSRTTKQSEKLFGEIIKAADSDDFRELPTHRAILRIAAGEHFARQREPKSIEKSLEQFGSALGDLNGAPHGSYDRDYLTGELALAMLNLGEDTTPATENPKIPWVPQPPKPGRAQIRNDKAREEGVYGQVRRVMGSMLTNQADLDIRACVARKVARELIAKSLPASDLDNFLLMLSTGFNEAEAAEVQGQIGLILHQANLPDLAKKRANLPSPASRALAKILELPDAKIEGDDPRLTPMYIALAKNDPEGARKAADGPGKPADRIRALSLAAEMSGDPAPFLEAAEKAIGDFKPSPNEPALSLYPVVRLTALAARHGDAARTASFLKAISHPQLQAYAEGEALRQRLLREPNAAAPETDAVLPTDPADPKQLFAGHAWGRYHLARHNGYSDAGLGSKYFRSWPSPLVAPYGLAGALLGAQDKSVKP